MLCCRTLRVSVTALALAALPGLIVRAAPDLSAAGGGQPKAGDAATPTPLRRVIDVPKGFEKVTVGGHTALCEPNDVKWVTQALTDVKAPALPAGAPSNRAAAIKAKRDLLLQHLVTDLALTTDVDAKALIDDQLPFKLDLLDKTRPPLFYLVTTPARLRDIVKDGWGAPQFRYVPLTDSVSFSKQIPFTPDKEMDDTVWPAIYDDKDKDEAAKVKGVTNLIQGMDANVLNTAAQQAGSLIFGQFVSFIQDRCVAPLNLKADQKWLGVGLTNYLGAKYSALVMDVKKEDLVNQLLAEPEVVPVSMRTVDLLHPADEKTMKEEMRPYYAVATQRKATFMVAIWAEQAGGDAGIPAVLKAVRAKLPEDGRALLAVVKDAGKVDMDKYFGITPPPAAPK